MALRHSMAIGDYRPSCHSPWPIAKGCDNVDEENPDSNYDNEVTVQGDALDHIIKDHKIGRVDHIQMKISGAELEALEEMKGVFGSKGTRLLIRTLHFNEAHNVRGKYVVMEKLRGEGLLTGFARPQKVFSEGRMFMPVLGSTEYCPQFIYCETAL